MPRDVIDIANPILLEGGFTFSAREWRGIVAIGLFLVYLAGAFVHTTITLIQWAMP